MAARFLATPQDARTIGIVTVITGQVPARGSRIAGSVTTSTRRAVAGVKAFAVRLSGSILTIGGLACIDVGAFEAHPIAGWLVTGASILVFDWKLEGTGHGTRPGDRS